MRKLLIIYLTISLAACNIPLSKTSRLPSVASATPSSQPCYLNWASQPLPDLSSRVQAAMETNKVADARVTVEAYGENCYDALTNLPVSFTAMETDFRISIQVKDIKDHEQLGNLLERILVVLDGFPTGSTPGPMPGYVGVTFQSGNEELRLWFPSTAGTSARAQGLHGAALLEKIQK